MTSRPSPAATIEAASRAGCTTVWLEVIDENHQAIGLYEELGFQVVRDVVVWSLPASGRPVPAHRGTTEPPPTCSRPRPWTKPRPPRSCSRPPVTSGALRFANAPAEEAFSSALQRLGADLVARQHEMRLSFS